MKTIAKLPKLMLVIAGMTLAIFGFGGASTQAATLTAAADDCVEIGGDGYTDCLEMGDSGWYNNVDSVCNYSDDTVSVTVRQYDEDDDKYWKSGYMYWENGYMYWHDNNDHHDYNHDYDEDEYSLDADKCVTFDSTDAEISVD